MEVHIDKLIAAKAFETVPQPLSGSTILLGKWGFDLKIDKGGETMPLFLSIVVIKNMLLQQVDYTAAYLNAIIDGRTVFMRQPTGFEKIGPNGERLVCLVLQAMYGLRQAGHLWYATIAKALKKMEFEPLVDEPCIMVHHAKGIWILLCVDDTLIAASDDSGVNWFRETVRFKYRDLGKPNRFLGSILSRGLRGIFLNQKVYAEEVIMKAGL